MARGATGARELDPGDSHVVQLYPPGAFPARAVASWAADALRAGNGAVLVGTRAHLDAVRARLSTEGVDADRAEADGRLACGDADAWLAEFTTGPRIDGAAFHALASTVLERVRDASTGGGRIRFWGEMVNVLWTRGHVRAAERLEAFGNELIHDEPVAILCTYALDNLDPSTHAGPLHDLCAVHTRLAPVTDPERLDAAVTRALVDVFGAREARTVRQLFATSERHATAMPPAQAILMGVHTISSRLGERVLEATRKHWQTAGPAQ